MALKKALLDILCCPVTHSPLHLMPPAALEQFNQVIGDGVVKRLDGRVVSRPWPAALVTEDGTRAYPVRDEIPILLEQEAVYIVPLEIAAP